MPVIRTLIIEDSAFVRKVVREMLATSPHIEVVGVARNGHEGLAMVEELKPDVVTCDLNMPEMDGVAFVRQQMARKAVPILILTASPADAEHVLDALEAGAVDLIRKPTALANQDILQIRQELCDKVKAAAQARSNRVAIPTTIAGDTVLSKASRGKSRVDIVVLGVSTGGPQALRFLVPQFPADFPVALVMVLHIPVGYTTMFAKKLSEVSRLPVTEAFEGCPVRAGEALLAPAGQHLTFRRGPTGEVVVHLSLQPSDKPHRPSVDVLFKSAAEIYGERVMGVVLTGMGSDGTEGAAWIKGAGGIVLTEAEESCIIYGMPRSVVESGLSDAAVPLVSMATEINKQL